MTSSNAFLPQGRQAQSEARRTPLQAAAAASLRPESKAMARSIRTQLDVDNLMEWTSDLKEEQELSNLVAYNLKESDLKRAVEVAKDDLERAVESLFDKKQVLYTYQSNNIKQVIEGNKLVRRCQKRKVMDLSKKCFKKSIVEDASSSDVD